MESRNCTQRKPIREKEVERLKGCGRIIESLREMIRNRWVRGSPFREEGKRRKKRRRSNICNIQGEGTPKW